jgi:L-ribulokinase
VGIGVDTTGSTPIPVAADGMPVGMQEGFKENLAAMAWLWKDHTSLEEAAEITEKARAQGRPYLAKCGGTYSSEWLWSKALHCARTAPDVFAATHSWMELCDFIPSRLTQLGEAVPRSICAAGHKGMYAEQWGGLPDREFLSSVEPALGELRDRMFEKAFPSDHVAGPLCEARAESFGLKAGVQVAVGILDAHAGAVGSGVSPGRMVKIIGTSTCDILVAPLDGGVPDIPGVAGIVDGSVIPGMVGIEAGQSAVGDIFAWWARVCGRSQESLASEAARLRAGESGLLALDWNNGNRNVLADPLLTGLFLGQTLHSTAAEIYRALVEATAFGALKIIRRIEEHGVVISELVACGGIAEKSPLAMQIYADVLNRPIRLSRSGQAPALGAAIFGAVVGGVYPDVLSAQAAMVGFKDLSYQPDAASARVYQRLFGLYERVHDGFGVAGACDLQPVMKELIRVKRGG